MISVVQKKARDSLCIKRYEKLHARALLQEEHQEDEQGGSQKPQDDSGAKQDQDDDSGWASQGYRDVSPPLPQSPILSTAVDQQAAARVEAMPTHPTELNSKFEWDAVGFPSGYGEVSFEEKLAERWRERRRLSVATGPVQSPLIIVRETNRTGDVKLWKPESTCNAPKTQVIYRNEIKAEQTVTFPGKTASMSSKATPETSPQEILRENNRSLLQEQNSRLEKKLRLAQEKLSLSEAERQYADTRAEVAEKNLTDYHAFAEKLRLADLNYHTARDILQSITSSLAIFCRDLSKNDADHLEAVVAFAENIRAKIDSIVLTRSANAPDEHIEVLRSVTSNVVHTVNQWRSRMLVKPLAREAFHATFGDDENVRSATRSSILPSSQQSDRTNPMIKAMWNQTNQTINTTCRDPPKGQFHFGNGDLIRQDDGNGGQAASEGPKAFSEAPIRQSLAPARKSEKPRQTMTAADLENQPMSSAVYHQTTNFQIFADHSFAPDYLPSIAPNNLTAAEKDSDDDSENTPPLDGMQADLISKSQLRHVAGILNDSTDHPGVPVERLTEKDFIEVDSDSGSDSDRNEAVLPLPGSEPLQEKQASHIGFSAPPQPWPRKSLVFGDLVDEFSTIFESVGRKSLGFNDQTLPYPANQSEFVQYIDPKKHMSSTPVVLTIVEEANRDLARRRPRSSYLPPAGASKLLSPITEGSRENKTVTPSSGVSGLSTWMHSKKSLGK